MAIRNWTREELILTFNLYWQLDFGKMHSRTPEIIHLANIIGRTPDFDKGYISINDNFEILISPVLKKKQKENYYEKYFAHLTNSTLHLPKKYLPKKEFLEFHLDTIFKR